VESVSGRGANYRTVSPFADTLPLSVDGVVDELLAACAAVDLPAGTRRVASQLPQTILFAIEDGIVVVTAQVEGASRRSIVATAREGSLLPPPSAGEAFEAVTDARLRVISAAVWEELLASPAAAAAIAGGLVSELRDRQESLRHFANVRHVERVREKLLQLARVHGRVGSGGVRLDLPLTHELLAEMVGSRRETVTFALADLQKEGFVSREGRTYVLLVSPADLAQ
jgi:CRP/FNR family cyclic AMP-dependent transcriptional regulator